MRHVDALSRLRRSRMAAWSQGIGFSPDFQVRPAGRAAGPRAADTVDSRAHMYIYDMIDDDPWYGINASMVMRALVEAGGADLVVHINSPGGMVIEGLAIYNNLRNYTGDVEVRIEGGALSAASFIALAGNRTVIEQAAMMMVHDAWDIAIGNADGFRKAAEALDGASDTMAGIYAGKTGDTPEEWRAVLKAERWYTSGQALDAGLVDEVAGMAAPVEDAAEDTSIEDATSAAAKWDAFIPAQHRAPAPAAAAVVPPVDDVFTLTQGDLDSLRESLRGAWNDVSC